MKVKLAKTAGFCMGVRRAMNIVLDAANSKKGKLYTYGPLVHNPQAVEMLKHKGVEIIGDDSVSNATVILSNSSPAASIKSTKPTIRAYFREGKIKGQKITGKWYITEGNLKNYLSGDYPVQNK